jgi:DNA-binding MarR family transcriptional regulator
MVFPMTDPSPWPSRPAARAAEELRVLIGRFKRRLREQSPVGGLTPSQIAVLLRLERDGPTTASALARCEAMRPQSMGKIITSLEAEGLVAGRPDARDGRRTILSLTERCRIWVREGRAARRDWLSRTIEERLSAAEQNDLVAAIALLTRLIDD